MCDTDVEWRGRKGCRGRCTYAVWGRQCSVWSVHVCSRHHVERERETERERERVCVCEREREKERERETAREKEIQRDM